MSVKWNDAALRARVERATMRGVVRVTEAVRNEAIALILNTQKTGRIYTRRGVTHQASAPGEPPASNTGRLVNSIQTVYDTKNLTGTVGTSVEYGGYLEFGTQTIEPRPFLRPALATHRRSLSRIIKDEIARELRS